MASLVSSSLKTGRLIFIWPPSSLWGCQPWCGHLEPPNPSDIDNTDEEVDAELWSLSNLWSDESKSDWDGATHNSYCLISGLWWYLTSLLVYWSVARSGHLPLVSSCWEVMWLWRQILILKIEWCWCRWNGMRVTRPSWFNVSFGDGLGDQLPNITQAYQFGTELGLFANPANGSWTVRMWCLMPCPSSVLLLMITTHRTEWPCLAWSLQFLSGQICHLEPCLTWLAPATCEEVLVSLPHLWWRSLVFPNNTEPQANQVLVFLLETGMVIVMGHY